MRPLMLKRIVLTLLIGSALSGRVSTPIRIPQF